ncbi:MAG TPA: hypothetical protein VMG40_14165, partial [Bryobacteraceae bacterium]|nr:hypothetical protein [Bryobacteraceae bacterium]
MLLSSSAYFIFLFAVFALYWPVSRFRTLTLGVVLFANYFFYAKWDLFYLALIPAVSSCDYVIGLGLQDSENRLVRRILVTLSIVMNVGLLASIKYVPFFLSNWSVVSGRSAPAWNFVLPVSLSFYVFQALTYTIDLYRRDSKGTRSYLAHLS